jgi:R3H domain
MASSLTPSQAIRTSTSDGNANGCNPSSGMETNNTSSGNRNGRHRRRIKNKGNGNGNGDSVNLNKPETNSTEAPADVDATQIISNQIAGKNKSKNQRRRKNKNQEKDKDSGNTDEGKDVDAEQPVNGKQSKSKGNKRNKNRKRYPWRKYIPAGTVDPITLDELVSIPYPPFALRASSPYLPVPEWPPGQAEKQQPSPEELAKALQLEAQERERSLLQEQWGTAIVAMDGDAKGLAASTTTAADNNNNNHHVNLFDGRALAYYMVSQLQFIDPLTRRDLDREELCHLDRYLVRNNFTDLNVVEAYDTKGVSLSTAGAASRTAAGRAEILQQEARVLLTALFGGGPSALPPLSTRQQQRPTNTSSVVNPLMQQYSSFQRSSQQRQQQQASSQPQSNNDNGSNFGNHYGEDTGIYGDEAGGMMVIDDDMNPSLRGGGRNIGQVYQAYNNSQWSANRLTGQNQTTNLQADNFPALNAVTTLPPGQSPLNTNAPDFVPGGPGGVPRAASAPSQNPARQPPPKKNLPPAKSLKIIAGAVKKTTPEEAQRQFEAREEARRKAVLSNLTFGANPASWDAPSSVPTSSMTYTPTEAQMARNQAFADALGLASTPASEARIVKGWARPTNPDVRTITQYPDSLILKARESTGQLLKLERKWKTFLEDDNAASLPLYPMARDLRAFVHEYSDHWKLHTESFDPEPKRYVHCVKLLDTSAPYPLLSDAAKHWRGATGIAKSSDYVTQQTAGQDTWGREVELPRGPRVRDRSVEPPLASNPRAAGLASERPKLELTERTLPLELSPFAPPASSGVEIESEEQIRRRQMKREEQKRKEREREERKQRVLQAAFASDDEEGSLREIGKDDDESDWEELEALYHSDDE